MFLSLSGNKVLIFLVFQTMEKSVDSVDILKVLKTAKPVKDNLNRKQRTALRELKNDENISIYPFDKGSGLVRIRKQDAIDKIREQIGNTNIITDDPTKKFATDIRKLLSTLNKKV